jgi:hypothetical protein
MMTPQIDLRNSRRKISMGAPAGLVAPEVRAVEAAVEAERVAEAMAL